MKWKSCHWSVCRKILLAHSNMSSLFTASHHDPCETISPENRIIQNNGNLYASTLFECKLVRVWVCECVLLPCICFAFSWPYFLINNKIENERIEKALEAVANEIGSYGQKIESTTTKSGPKERENCRCSDIGNAQLLQHRTKNQLTRKNGNSKKKLDKQFACIFDLDGSICSHRKEHFLVDLLVFDTNTLHLHRNINNIAFYSLRCFFFAAPFFR